MMKFLEIKDGLLVKISAITAVERLNDFDLRITVNGFTYDTTFPFETLKSVLEMEQDSSEKDKLSQINESIRNLPIQVFAG